MVVTTFSASPMANDQATRPETVFCACWRQAYNMNSALGSQAANPPKKPEVDHVRLFNPNAALTRIKVNNCRINNFLAAFPPPLPYNKKDTDMTSILSYLAGGMLNAVQRCFTHLSQAVKTEQIIRATQWNSMNK